MRLESYLSIEHVDDPQNQSLTLTLINIRSINKHLIDLAYDERLRKSDLIMSNRNTNDAKITN